MTRQFHRIVQRVRAIDRRHPLPWNFLLTGFFITASLIDVTSGGWRNIAENPDVPVWLVTTMSLCFSVPLLWRRTHPFAVLLVMFPASVTNAWTGAVLQANLTLLVVLFNVALRTRLRTLLCSYALVVTPFIVTGFRYPAEQGAEQNIVPAAMSLALAAVGGIAVRTRKEYLASLVERARQLEIERDQQSMLAAAAERARIAREMHDIIGHNLSVITGLADGGRYAATKSPERAAQALDAIGTTSRQALAELRRLLDVLRDDPEDLELAPQPSLTDLDHLIKGVRAAGLPVRTTIHGRASLPPGRQLTVYRVIQEALTNTLKHGGPGSTSQIEISYEDGGAVTVTITDTGRGGTPSTEDGRGLPGMRERTSLYGGTLEAAPGPGPESGWRVHLHLPKESAHVPQDSDHLPQGESAPHRKEEPAP
ncbi:sensor histidine kinase [Streptomyces sp. NBC_00038]|uniref:sensor histidine kinase n=1 Tax=Streptomyces sp. NBC_00038 TaxID=2903615 RepID=UPI00225AA549|nr:histidine kinase [Streptomyces sp. NBC_00038]MCX5558825.1 histidine kinase [Streptomyces sp. NBC_00038]